MSGRLDRMTILPKATQFVNLAVLQIYKAVCKMYEILPVLVLFGLDLALSQHKTCKVFIALSVCFTTLRNRAVLSNTFPSIIVRIKIARFVRHFIIFTVKMVKTDP